MLPTTYSFILLPFIRIHSFPSRQIPATDCPRTFRHPRLGRRLGSATRPAQRAHACGSRLRCRKSTGSDRLRLAVGVGRPVSLRFFVMPTPELAPNAAELELEGPGRTVQSGAWQAFGSRKFSGKCDTHF